MELAKTSAPFGKVDHEELALLLFSMSGIKHLSVEPPPPPLPQLALHNLNPSLQLSVGIRSDQQEISFRMCSTVLKILAVLFEYIDVQKFMANPFRRET